MASSFDYYSYVVLYQEFFCYLNMLLPPSIYPFINKSYHSLENITHQQKKVKWTRFDPSINLQRLKISVKGEGGLSCLVSEVLYVSLSNNKKGIPAVIATFICHCQACFTKHPGLLIFNISLTFSRCNLLFINLNLKVI